MSFTVDDFQDLLRVLERHPEWRAELRRHILSDELLALPPLVRELAAAQVRTEQRLAQLTERVDALVKQIAALVGQVEGILVRLDRHEDRLGRLEGDLLELRYASHAPAYYAPLARRLRVIDSAALADPLD